MDNDTRGAIVDMAATLTAMLQVMIDNGLTTHDDFIDTKKHALLSLGQLAEKQFADGLVGGREAIDAVQEAIFEAFRSDNPS